MSAQTEQVDDLRLVALPSATNIADIFVRFSLTEWRLKPLQEQAATVVRAMVSETVRLYNPDNPGIIVVRLRLSGNNLIIELEGQYVAVPAHYAGPRSGIVDLTAGGRLVWHEMPLPSGLTAAAVPLPRRGRRHSRATSASDVEATSQFNDFSQELARRVLYGLSESS